MAVGSDARPKLVIAHLRLEKREQVGCEIVPMVGEARSLLWWLVIDRFLSRKWGDVMLQFLAKKSMLR